jgi:hypothetical protein
MIHSLSAAICGGPVRPRYFRRGPSKQAPFAVHSIGSDDWSFLAIAAVRVGVGLFLLLGRSLPADQVADRRVEA